MELRYGIPYRISEIKLPAKADQGGNLDAWPCVNPVHGLVFISIADDETR